MKLQCAAGMKNIVRAISRLRPGSIKTALAKPSSTERSSLPVELWSAIFEADTLEKCDLLCIRLTCRKFASVARPMAFRSLHLGPSIPNDRHLAFWFSRDIAPHVQAISIHCNIEHPDISLQAVFFGALVKCVNISYLRCEAVQFDDNALAAVSRLLQLQTIVLFDCGLTLNKTPLILKVNKVHFGSNATRHTDSNAQRNLQRYGWLDILCPRTISELTLELPRLGPWSFKGIETSAMHPYMNGPLGYTAYTIRTLMRIISHPTALESLTICPFEEQHSLKYINFYISLPSLRTYSGIHYVIHRKCLMLSEQLRSLTLRTNTIQNGLDLEDGALLNIIPHANALYELRANVALLSASLLDRICAEYPSIRVLSISARDFHPSVSC